MIHFSLLFLLGWALYFLPSVIAYRRGLPRLPVLFAVNALIGWTVIGWVVVLIWSLMEAEPLRPPVVQQMRGPVIPPGAPND